MVSWESLLVQPPPVELTERQASAIVAADMVGFFEVPKTGRAHDFADILGITAGPASRRIRLAERELMTALAEEVPDRLTPEGAVLVTSGGGKYHKPDSNGRPSCTADRSGTDYRLKPRKAVVPTFEACLSCYPGGALDVVAEGVGETVDRQEEGGERVVGTDGDDQPPDEVEEYRELADDMEASPR